MYLEHGFEQVEPAVVEAFDARIEFARTGHVDNKTELQEALARSGNQVQYDVIDVEGPPHDRRFVCVAVIAGEQVGIGSGSTKKAAEQEAARAGTGVAGARRARALITDRRKATGFSLSPGRCAYRGSSR